MIFKGIYKATDSKNILSWKPTVITGCLEHCVKKDSEAASGLLGKKAMIN